MAMIENSDRGITLSKGLAWVMVVGLLSAGIKLGAQMAELRGETSTLSQTINGLRVDLTASEARQVALASRVRANENALARQDERLSLILSTLNKIDTRLERMERLPIR